MTRTLRLLIVASLLLPFVGALATVRYLMPRPDYPAAFWTLSSAVLGYAAWTTILS